MYWSYLHLPILKLSKWSRNNLCRKIKRKIKWMEPAGRKFRKTTTGSQHRGGKQNQKHKTTPDQMDVSETVKRSKLPLSEPLRCSPQGYSLPIQLPCISHTSRSISEKVASSGSRLSCNGARGNGEKKNQIHIDPFVLPDPQSLQVTAFDLEGTH